MKTDYMKVNWMELVVTPMRGKTDRELEEILEAALKRAVNSEESGVVRSEADMLVGRIEAEQGRRDNRLMLRIAFWTLMVTGVAVLADLIPKLIQWLSKLVKLAGL